MKKSLLALCAALLVLPSCLDDNDVDYSEWKEANETYYTSTQAETNPDGSKAYETISPDWAPGYEALVKWHTPRQTDEITPMDNSVVDVVYELKNINGTTLDSSYSNSLWGDSIYRTTPKNCIPGFWITLTQMAPGDSVTAVVPWVSAYGKTGTTTVPPYSTLIFNIKLKKIVAWEVPN